MEMKVLGIDTCGPSGSVALGRMTGGGVEILDQTELAGRSYSATLVAAVSDLLAKAGAQLDLLHAIVVVNGPGSFTGVRVGLSAAKGLAEGAGIPVAAVSRLEVLGAKARIACAALDAHRNEVYLRIAGPGGKYKELLAGAEEMARIDPAPARIAVCEDGAALLAGTVWPEAEIVRTTAPTAAEALEVCAERVARGEFVDIALLDGHYLRRSDAEIFGDLSAAGPRRA